MPHRQASLVVDRTGTDNPAGLPGTEVEKLLRGGLPGDLRWLCPYEGTVFPRDMLSPTLMWSGAASADAVYRHFKSQLFDYKTVIKPQAAQGLAAPIGAVMGSTALQPQLRVPQELLLEVAWRRRGVGCDRKNSCARRGGSTLVRRRRRAMWWLPFGRGQRRTHDRAGGSPVAAGGYFWVFFDSLRNYGNLGLQRALWGAAIDILPNGQYVIDSSHPPFYVVGQEFGADNHRVFAARDLCAADGASCKTGIDCCSGFCASSASPAMELAEPTGKCVPPEQNRCSKRDEHCETRADCCEVELACINHFCAVVELL